MNNLNEIFNTIKPLNSFENLLEAFLEINYDGSEDSILLLQSVRPLFHFYPLSTQFSPFGKMSPKWLP